MSSETLTAEDKRYAEMFNIAKQEAYRGLDDLDHSEGMNALRERAPVMKGSSRALLGLPEMDASHFVGTPRENWTLLSFAACERGFRENMIFSSAAYDESRGISSMGKTIISMIGKEHKSYRAVGQPLFLRPRVLDWWKRRWIDQAVDMLLDRLEGRDAIDLNSELCARLPTYVVTQSIGLEGEDALSFRHHLTNSTFAQGAISAEEAAFSRAEVDRILARLIVQRRAEGGSDVITGLLENDLKLPDGTSRKLTDAEVFGYCKLIIFAGGGTTWRQLGITLDALLSHYHFWEEVRDDRSLLEPAIDEALRWRATDSLFPRLTTEDVEVEGVTIPKGVRVEICLAAGNRDPKVFERPDEYDIHRPKHHNLGLGVGPHRCIGMDVAKQQMHAAISGLMDRWPNLHHDPDQPRPNFVGHEHRGMTGVPVRLS